MKKSAPLTVALGRWFETAVAELPADVRQIVDRHFAVPFPWDTLTPALRRRLAKKLDAQYSPHDLVEKRAFHEGFKKVAVPRRNKRNAARPRPARQQVSDGEILALKLEVQSDGVKHHKQCSEALRRLLEHRPKALKKSGFLKRWNKLNLNKKDT